ncbi:hypothetical protein PTKIN_Ptkin18bG0092700 [Pterospermum kingtungense]
MDGGQQNSVHGSCPEYGAIFMSNSAMRKEFLRRKVFALPYSLSKFVKQVKDGMILFLFEFERRELYGVFQACSDGAMNILPHVFSSSGKQFPAQVKFTPLWNCRPLSENEFRDAIKENYFSKAKFKFGLSKDQVQRLLSLFNLKRLNDHAPQRQLTRSKVARPSGYPTSKIRRVVDNDWSPVGSQVPGECHADNNCRPVVSTMHHGDSFYNDGGATADGTFETYTDGGYEHKASAFLNECFQDIIGKAGRNIDAGVYATSDRVDVEWNTGIGLQSAASVGYSSGNFRSISNDVRSAKSDRLEGKRYEDDGFAPTLSTAYPSSFQSKANPWAYSSKYVPETDAFIDDPARRCSTFLPSMEVQNSNVSYPMNFEDSVVTTTLPYDSHVPSIRYQGSSSLGFNQSHASSKEYTSHDSFVGNVLGSSTNQPFLSLLETRRTTITPDVNFGSEDFVPLPYSNQYERSSRTSLPRHDYLDDLAAEYSKKESFGDPSFLNPCLAPVPSSEIRNNIRISEQPSSYRTSPGKFPCITFSDRYPTLLQDKNEYQVPESKNNAEFGNDGIIFKECQHHEDSFYNNRAIDDGRFAIYKKNVEYEQKESQHQLHVHELTNGDHHDIASSSPAYRNSECLYPDHQKQRSNVFSRLALPPKACKRERNTPHGSALIDTNTSVNEVMNMLHQKHYHWETTRCKKLVKHHDTAANIRDKKQAFRKEGLAIISKEINPKPISLSKDHSNQKTEDATFVNFKRRSAVRKLEDGKTVNHRESLNNKSASDAHSKKRKLIRPDFGENESSVRGISHDAPENIIASADSKKRKLIRPDFGKNESSDRGISHDAPKNIIASATESSGRRNAESIKVSVCHVSESDIPRSVKLQNLMCETAVEGDNIDKGTGSKSEQFSEESFIALRNADEGGKESTRSHGISGTASVSCGDMHTDTKQDLTTRDIRMDGLFPDLNDVSHSTHESSSKICEDNDGSRVANSRFFYNVEQINDLCPVGGEKLSISTVN